MPALKPGLFLVTICFAYGLAVPLPVPLPVPLHETAPVLECDGCKWLVGKVQAYLKTNEPRLNNATIGAVEKNICAHLPDNATAFCDHLVEQYVPFALDSLVEKILDPGFICTEVVPLCSETAMFQNATNRVKTPTTLQACVESVHKVSAHVSEHALLTHQIYTECKHEHPNHVLKCEVVSMHVSNTIELITNQSDVMMCESHVFNNANTGGKRQLLDQEDQEEDQEEDQDDQNQDQEEDQEDQYQDQDEDQGARKLLFIKKGVSFIKQKVPKIVKTTVKIAKTAAPFVSPAINLVPGASGPLAIAKLIVPKLKDSKLKDSKLKDFKLKLKDSKLKDFKLKTLIPKVASKLKDFKLKASKLKDSKLKDSKLKTLIPKVASKLKDSKLKLKDSKLKLKDSKLKLKDSKLKSESDASSDPGSYGSDASSSDPVSYGSDAFSDSSSSSSSSDASSSESGSYVPDASTSDSNSDSGSSDSSEVLSKQTAVDESFAKQYKTLIQKENENHLSDVKLLASLAKKTIKIENERSRLQSILTKLKGILPDSQTNDFNIIFKEVISIFDSHVSKCS